MADQKIMIRSVMRSAVYAARVPSLVSRSPTLSSVQRLPALLVDGLGVREVTLQLVCDLP